MGTIIWIIFNNLKMEYFMLAADWSAYRDLKHRSIYNN